MHLPHRDHPRDDGLVGALDRPVTSRVEPVVGPADRELTGQDRGRDERRRACAGPDAHGEEAREHRDQDRGPRMARERESPQRRRRCSRPHEVSTRPTLATRGLRVPVTRCVDVAVARGRTGPAGYRALSERDHGHDRAPADPLARDARRARPAPRRERRPDAPHGPGPRRVRGAHVVRRGQRPLHPRRHGPRRGGVPDRSRRRGHRPRRGRLPALHLCHRDRSALDRRTARDAAGAADRRQAAAVVRARLRRGRRRDRARARLPRRAPAGRGPARVGRAVLAHAPAR
ncbi:hypothetical protein D3C74_314970 [compost metagenome]